MADEDTATNGTSDEAAVAALENALAGEQDFASAESATATLEETEASKGNSSQSVPYDRFKQVISARDTASAEAREYQDKLSAQDETVARLSAMLEHSQADSNTLQSLKDLAHDPDYREHVEILDRALRGIEEVPELPEDATPEDHLVRAQEQLDVANSQLAEDVAEQRVDLIVDRAEHIAERMLDQLPESYTDQDREVISRIWDNAVDWDQVEENPEELGTILNSALQDTLNVFGEPRGGLVSLEDYEVLDEGDIEYVDEGPTPQEELAALVGTDYGKIKMDDAGKPLGPEVSDAEFAADMAKAMKVMNKS